MRSTIVSFVAGSLLICFGALQAQQPNANRAAGASATRGGGQPAPRTAPRGPTVLDQQAPRNPAVRLQQNQRGNVQRTPQRQLFPPFTNRNERDPREDAALDQLNLQNNGLNGQDVRSRGFDESGRLLDARGRPLDPQGRPLDALGRPLDRQGLPRDSQGRPLDEQGRPLDDQGRPLDENGRPIDDQQGLSDGLLSSAVGGVAGSSTSSGIASAEVIRSSGEYNLNTAAGAVLREEAREHALENRQKQVENYFEVRQLNRQERNEERGRMPTQADVIRYSQSRLPERLSLTELDRHTGAIHWPVALLAPEFDEHRARLEQVFEARSYTNSGLASPSYVEIKQETESMLATLQDRVREIDPASYLQARKFIVGLGFEGRFLAGDENIALRS